MNFYDINEGGFIGDSYIRGYDTVGIKGLSQSLRTIPKEGLICFADISNPNSYPGTGNTITDLSGNGIDLTFPGTNETYSSSFGGFINFAGGNAGGSYATVPAGKESNLNFQTSNFSFSLWYRCGNIRPVGTASRQYIFMKGTINTNGYSFYATNASRFVFDTYQTSATQTTNTINNLQPLNVDRWCNVTITRNGNSIRIYVDGEDVTANAGNHTSPGNTAANFYLNASSTPDQYGRGTAIAMMLIYNRALDATEVLDIFNATESRFPI